jgi:predicted branched-subunit amino acid permease
LRAGIPIGLGYLSVSFAFGIFSVGSGLSITETILISMFNLTSAGQLAAVPIIATGGGFLELISTQLIINLRYALMSVSLSQKMDAGVRVRDRLVISFANTDEVFAVASANAGEVGRRYMYGLIITPFLGWTLGTATGAIATTVMPEALSSAMGIALYGMFIAIVVPPARENSKVLVAVLAAISGSLLFAYTPFLKNISGGWTIIIITLVVSALCATLFPIKEEGGEV